MNQCKAGNARSVRLMEAAGDRRSLLLLHLPLYLLLYPDVCPSIHVLGAMGALFAALWLECFRTPVRRRLWGLLTGLICLPTVFLKQHSVLDIVAALPLAGLAGWLCFGRRERDAQ